MSKAITFSRQFPSHHLRAGEPTLFVERIWQSIRPKYEDLPRELLQERRNWRLGVDWDRKPKHHTIRAGNRWKVGDKFSPRIWRLPGGRFTKGNQQITFAPDIEIKRVWDLKVWKFANERKAVFMVNNKSIGWWHKSNDHELIDCKIQELAHNDGVTFYDLISWLGMDKSKRAEFSGQILCWNDQIDYQVDPGERSGLRGEFNLRSAVWKGIETQAVMVRVESKSKD